MPINFSGKIEEQRKRNKKNYIKNNLGAFVVFCLTIFVWGGIFVWGKVVEKQTRNTIEKADQTLAFFKGDDADRVADFSTRSNMADNYFKKERRPEDLFVTIVQKAILPDVFLETYRYEVDTKTGKEQVDLVANADDFDTVAQQILNIKEQDEVDGVTVSKTSRKDGSRVGFSMLIVFK